MDEDSDAPEPELYAIHIGRIFGLGNTDGEAVVAVFFDEEVFDRFVDDIKIYLPNFGPIILPYSTIKTFQAFCERKEVKVIRDPCIELSMSKYDSSPNGAITVAITEATTAKVV